MPRRWQALRASSWPRSPRRCRRDSPPCRTRPRPPSSARALPAPRPSRPGLKPAEIFLGVLTAVGGFVDVSELVFMSQAGSRFGYALIWVVVLSTVGIMVFGEMSGRVAAIAKQPVFNLMRNRLGLRLGLVTLIASFISNLITCAAEIGGVALVLQLLTGAPMRLMALAATAAFIATVWFLPFKWIERSYGLLGLFMLVFGAALAAIHPPWGQLAGGLVPQVPRGLSTRDLVAFAYFAVALL